MRREWTLTKAIDARDARRAGIAGSFPRGRTIPAGHRDDQSKLNHLRCWRSSSPHWHTNCGRLRNDAEEDAIMKNTLKNFLADETGATAIDYGLIAAGIALAI